MGTNYYTTKKKHIGKRSAAGDYCWDCNVTLCKGGNKEIHNNTEWYESCLICHNNILDEDLKNSSVGRELGFNKNKYQKKIGVTSCSSFTWAISKDEINKLKFIVDEYGRKFTKKQFEEILTECPIQFEHNIGREFS